MCLYHWKETLRIYRHLIIDGEYSCNFFDFDVAYGIHRTYYDGWHFSINTGVINFYIYW
jgi:hypothetical protein